MARILVVTPDPAEARLLDAHLRSGGHVPVHTASGREALSIARASLPDLVLLDGSLPDSSSGDVCRTLAAFPETSAIPVVILSHRGD